MAPQRDYDNEENSSAQECDSAALENHSASELRRAELEAETEKIAGLDTFLAAAVEHKFIKPIEITRIQSYAKSNNINPSDAALNLAVLATSEVEAIKYLIDPQDLLPGYELKKLIGYGAGGMVFSARQLALARDVAVKTISPSVQISNSVPRMQREALSIARLQHPNIVSVYDSAFANGRFCIAMELVEGGSLADRIKEQGRLSEQTAWYITRQIASALHHANDRGIIHRDIKPGNILLGRPPVGVALPEGVPFVKVADFGLALERESDDAQLTATGTGLGTPAYVAPEQIDDSHVDMRADVYALGATVFHMLTGIEPYAHTSPVKVITKKNTGDDSWRDELATDISAGSRQLFLDLTESNADHRIGDYEEIIERIDEVLLFASNIAPEPLPPNFESEKVDAHNATRTFKRIEVNGEKTRRVATKWLIASVCLLAIPLLGYLGVRRFDSNPTPKEPLIVTSNWHPEGLPTPLFNGRSVPRFRQTGVWQPKVAADGSVLSGRAGSTLNLPIAIDGIAHSRLRFAVNLKPDEKVSLGTRRGGKLVEFLSLDHKAARAGDGPDAKSIEFSQPANDGDGGVFQRIELEFLRDATTLGVVVNGNLLQERPSDIGEITIRCVEGEPAFADMDLGPMVVREEG